MLIHHYDPATGIYQGSNPADPDPRELEKARDAHAAPLIAAANAAHQARLAEIAEERLSIEPTIWLVPAHATLAAPPEVAANEEAVMTDDGWIVRPMADPDADADQTPAPTNDAATVVRAARDRAMASVRPLIDRHRDEIDLGMPTTLSPAQFQALLTYVQSLREVPDQPNFPAGVDWPAAPNFVSTLILPAT